MEIREDMEIKEDMETKEDIQEERSLNVLDLRKSIKIMIL